jgi:HK97 gp10 family phage protein
MIGVSAKVQGLDALARRFEAKRALDGAQIAVALEESATIVQAAAQQKIMDGPKTGIIYKKYNPRRTHQASAPGEAPANDLGWLVANILIDKAEVLTGRIRIVGLAAYHKWLEFGTRLIAPRPSLRPALMESKPAVLAAFRRALTRMGRR